MAIRRKFKLSAVRLAFVLFLILAHSSFGGNAAFQIESLALSPDGGVIAIAVKAASTSFIYKVPVDSGIASRLTTAKAGEETSPAFSADGKRVAYVYWPGNKEGPRIVIVDADGSNPRQRSPSGVAEVSPVFSADNKTIVFSRAQFYGSYSPIAQPHPHDWFFYASNLDGTNVRQITTESFYNVSPPSISADGEKMVVVTETLQTSPQIQIFSTVHPGPALRTFQPHVPKEEDHKNPTFTYPNFLPDGTILFMAASNGKHGTDYEIYRLAVTTETITKLTNGNEYATALTVSADGTTAAFLKWHKNWLREVTDSQVYVLDLKKGSLRPLKITGL